VSVVELVGRAAAFVGAVLGLPQLWRLIRTRNVDGLSLFAWQSILVVNLLTGVNLIWYLLRRLGCVHCSSASGRWPADGSLDRAGLGVVDAVPVHVRAAGPLGVPAQRQRTEHAGQ